MIRLDQDELVSMLTVFGIVKEGHFKLTKGNHSNRYINKDAIWQRPVMAKMVIDSFIRLLMVHNDIEFDYITGPAVAGAIFAVNLALEFNSPFVYPEKIQVPYTINNDNTILYKTSMKFRRGFNRFIENKRGLIIEDIITTGGSVQDTIKAMNDCGSSCVGVLALWNRTEYRIRNIPVLSLIEEPVESWEPDNCPSCAANISLTDPKA